MAIIKQFDKRSGITYVYDSGIRKRKSSVKAPDFCSQERNRAHSGFQLVSYYLHFQGGSVMTLQQAHELQRRELISLRAKVARLEKQTTGLFPVEEKKL